MNIGIAVNNKDLNSMVSDKFEACNYLLIVNIRDDSPFHEIDIAGVTVIRNQEDDAGVELAKELIKHDCEAVVTGELSPVAFDMIADACITRYNGAGYSAVAALDLMNRRILKLIRNLEGTDACDESHHKH